MAVGPDSLQIIAVRQGYFSRCLSFHSDRVISREVSCQTQLRLRKLLSQGEAGRPNFSEVPPH